MRNDQVQTMGRLALARATHWNRASHDELGTLVREHRAEVVHFHNTFPLMSPSCYSASRASGAAVVQTLHNFRLLCPGATFFRDGKVCEDCLHAVAPWRAALHRCYRSSVAGSAVTASMLTWHRMRGTYRSQIDAYIALSEFGKQKFLEGGLPADRVHVKPNFLDEDHGAGAGDGGFALFVGRLVPEKGVDTLLGAWRELAGVLPLKIVGDGSMRAEVELAASRSAGIEYLGRKPFAEVLDLLGRATMLVFPSTWYEGMPRTIIESFSRGTPVVASDLGTMSSMIAHGQTGWLFPAGDSGALARAVRAALAAPLDPIRSRARREFEDKYTADDSLGSLLSIYQSAIKRRHFSTSTI